MKISGIIIGIILMFPFLSTAQTNQEKVVKTFGDNLSSWCSTEDDDYRFKIEELFRKDGVRVNNGLMHIFKERDETGLLSGKGSSMIDSYLNCLTRSIGQGLSYKHGSPVWIKDFSEPTAFNDKDAPPLYAVTMPMKVTGVVNYNGEDLFLIRGDKISYIDDYNSKNSIGKALELYTAKKYDEAFKIFRELAYADPTNYDAQYYTAIMEIKKQGCGYLGSKVRDQEASWWITRGLVANSYKSDWAKEQLEKLYYRFSIDDTKLPFNNMSADHFKYFLLCLRPITEGLMAFKSKNVYGFMDESGKIVIPCKYDFVYPFDGTGHSFVCKDNKWGFINKRGETVVPLKYDYGMHEFKNGRTYVVLNNELLLIDDKGTVIKNLKGNYNALGLEFFDDKVFAEDSETGRYRIFDMAGNMVADNENIYLSDRTTCSYHKEDNNGNTITQSYWK